jgi:hypothetical protein
MDLGLHAREPANVGLQPATTCGNPRRDLAKSPLSLVGIAKARVIGRVRTYSLPDRERELARQARASSRDDRIESGELALPLELGWIHPACHRLAFTATPWGSRSLATATDRRGCATMQQIAATPLFANVYQHCLHMPVLHRFKIPAHLVLSPH